MCSLLARLAHAEGKCILFSTHELDIALSLSDRIALIARTLSYTLSLYDTPPYVPGVEPDCEDYHLELQITMRMQYAYDGVQPPELPDMNEYETVSG